MHEVVSSAKCRVVGGKSFSALNLSNLLIDPETVVTFLPEKIT